MHRKHYRHGLHRWALKPSRIAIAAFGFIVSSCASVQSVTVVPSTACPGEPITVSWVARGDTVMAVVPLHGLTPATGARPTDFCVAALAAGIKLDPEPSHGTVALHASGDTVYLVQATGWLGKPAHRCARLFVNQILPLSDLPQCTPGAAGMSTQAARVHLVRPSNSRWSARTTTGVVDNINPVPVTVRHAGKSIVLPAGAKTDFFTGTDPNTGWWLEYAWTEGPPCGSAGAPVPNSLSLEVHPLCHAATPIAH